MEKKRCTWPGANELMIKYHDEEWGVAVHSDNKLFEFIVLDSFQAGLSWSTILNKRENFREAFDNFDYKKIANYDENKISKLLQNAGIIRNKLKIRATITNAQNFIKIQTEFGSFNKYIWQFVNHRTIQNKCKKNKDIPVSTPESDAMSKDLKKRGFKFVGTTICYAFMQAAGMVNDHLVNCFRYEELSKKTAPYIDNLILSSQNYHEVEHKLIIEKLLSVFSRMCCIEKQGDDEYRSIWITVERGKMEDYGDYKEAIESGEVDDKDNFEQLWKAYYPDEIKWYSFAVSKYEDTYYFYFDSKLTFQFKADSTNEQAYDFQSEISDWLLQIIDDNISRIEHNITEYNKYIDANLPYKKRTGRILRSDFWTIFPEFKEDFNKSISPQMIEILHKVKAQSETMSFKHLSEINSEDFFRYCEIGYDANKYFKKVKEVLTPKEKYKAMADGRDCGLKDIGNSYEEFVKWYKAAMNSEHIHGKYAEVAIRLIFHFLSIRMKMVGI